MPSSGTMNLVKMLLGMLIPLVKSIGLAKEMEDPDNIGKDDLVGQILVFIGDLGQFAVDTLNSVPATKPKVPDVLK